MGGEDKPMTAWKWYTKNRSSIALGVAIVALLAGVAGIIVGVLPVSSEVASAEHVYSMIKTVRDGDADSGAVITGDMPLNGTSLIVFDTEIHDDGYFDAGTSATKMVIPVSSNGFYHIGARCVFTCATTAAFRLSVVSTKIGTTDCFGSRAPEPEIAVYCPNVYLESADTLEFKVTTLDQAASGTCTAVIDQRITK